MEIRFNFKELWRHVDRISSERVDFSWVAEAKLEPIDIALHEGKEVKLEELEIVHGLLSVAGRQVLLYIPDQSVPLEQLKVDPQRGKRFHIADCATLEEMRDKGRFERYVVTNNLSGVFNVTGSLNGIKDMQVEAKLLVCRNCLSRLNYKGYNFSNKNKIWGEFDLSRFFETYSTSFKYIPKRFVEDNLSSAYVADWQEISNRVRARAAYCCDGCKLDLSQHQHLLHVHHINGVKTDNSAVNLRPLCIDCHRKQPLHDHMFISLKDMQLITCLRNEQMIVDYDWGGVLRHADLALQGVLSHAMNTNLPVPQLAYVVPSMSDCILDAAWVNEKIAISLAVKLPTIKGWDVYSPIAFMLRFK